MFDNLIDSKKQEILKAVSETISFPSISVETNDKNAPFGKNCSNVLSYVLNLGKSLGFRVKNIDGYCGYIEFGEGNELVGIIGHLDVVPADDNWTFSPFQTTIHDGKLYGRGAIDDKGPVIANLYAMKAVMDSTKVNKRVRLILGLNEEKSWKCINYYKVHEELPTIGFSPDADFPCIYAEKGILTAFLKQPYTNNYDISILKIDTNNNAINVVPKYCNCTLKLSDNLNTSTVGNKLKEIIDNYDFNINYKICENNTIDIISYGIAAHAAHPDLGCNAISRMLIILNDLFQNYNINLPILDLFAKYIGLETDGKKLNIDFNDESGNLTLNVGNLTILNNTIEIGMNLRIPIQTSIDKIKDILNSIISKYGNSVFINYTDQKQPLYVNKNDKLVQTLCNIFNNISGMKEEPIAIGGATYARAFENCISFGANMPGHKDMCHQVDEFIELDTLFLCTKIYAQAIYELSI